MGSMKRIIIIAFFCLLGIQAHAEVQIQIDPSQVRLGESFKLILMQNNPQGGGIPNLLPLQKDFVILGTERSVNYSIINGQTQSSSTWVVSLKAQRPGILTVPAIKIGSEQTTPLTINVSANANHPRAPISADQQQDIILTTEVSEKKPYVNQQITYKVTLYNSKQLLDASYQGPQVKNALLIPLGNGKHYQTQKNGITYLVEEQNYAIFPQKSGPLEITSPVFTAMVYDFDTQRIKAEDKPTTLNVQPIPKQFTGKKWLPAKEVKLSEQYEQIGPSISQGSTLVRTVTLEGVGIPAQLLPTLNFGETDAFSVYPEKGKEKNQVTQGELISNTEIKVTYLFNKSGIITIPELKLPWFNTTTGKQEIATLPARNITVTPSTTAPAATQQSPAKNQERAPATAAQTTTPTQNYWAWGTAALFALAWVITLILWGRQKHVKTSSKSAYKNALNALHKACTQGTPQQARDALLKWASLHWPDAPMLNLNDLSQRVTDGKLKKQVQILSQVLYKNTEKTLWRGDELWRSVQDLKQTHPEKKRKSSSLPPINPSLN